MLVLASSSTARRQLLRQITTDFAVAGHGHDEASEARDAESLARQCAAGKALSAARSPGSTIISADTVLRLGPRTLGKPASADEAVRQLQALSSSSFEAVTATAVLPAASTEAHCLIDVARVWLRALKGAEISHWLAQGLWPGCAGAFAIQSLCAGWVVRLRGDYSTVAGLNLSHCRRLLGRQAPAASSSAPRAALAP